ncbi:hypothetical protein BDW02DRAFT_602027 [Decorospora gaudefroyi]|uniref:Hypersensitive response inducing protein 1 n=1 Tax=Decorospora gaudefroyi TaxID=184978 RepID=A0A6A5K050_9PLEO|nr:hypothetical protein BDW02DRAFT_602027 [Decorospora gaudefroyi]
MRFTTILSTIFASTALAAPSMSTRSDEICTPISYTISDYTLTTSPGSSSVTFTMKSIFPADNPTDPVQQGAHCSGSGPTVPNNNVCAVANRRLLFDLRGPQEQAYYQITHTWSCNGATWMSGTALKIEPLTCHTEAQKRICTAAPTTFVPGNVRRICNAPTC